MSLTLFACQERDPSKGITDSVFADRFALEVLAEDKQLGGPTSDDPNRMLGGWIPTRVDGQGGFRLSSRGAGLRLVTLEAKSRRLELDLLGSLPSQPPDVQLRIDGGPPLLLQIADPLSIPLPRDLKVGSHVVEIAATSRDHAPLTVAKARITGPTAIGQAQIEGDSLIQSGWSLVDAVGRPEAATSLTGEFCPRADVNSGQRFSVEVASAEGGPPASWTWGGSFLDRLRGCVRFEVQLPDRKAPLRARFRSAGGGSPGEWRRVRWSGAGAKPESETLAPPNPIAAPRLVVLYIMDALRADYVGHLGGPDGVSATLDRLAAEGFTFRRHWSVAPNTWPSIRALFTGEVFVDAESWRRAALGRPTLAEFFGQAGYRTGLFSGNRYISSSPTLRRGFSHVSQAAALRLTRSSPRATNENARQVHTAALEWLQSLGPGERAFLYIHTLHPHNPYAPPEPFRSRFVSGIGSRINGDGRTLKRIERGEFVPSGADVARLRGLYAASLAYNDAELERFLQALLDRYPEREILLAITSDHGEELFDHGGVLHGYTLYEELLHIPLVLWSPGRVRPGESELLTDTVDLHSTLLDLIGARGTLGAPGRSLRPLAAGEQHLLPPRLHFAAAPGVRGGIYTVRDGPRKLIWSRGNRDGWAMGRGPASSWDRYYMFDLAADSDERFNRAGLGGIWEQWLRARLRRWVEERRGGGEAIGEDPEAAFDAETKRQLRALGYLD